MRDVGEGAERSKVGSVLIALVLLAGCGGGNGGPTGTGGTTGGTYAAKCEVGCRAPVGQCVADGYDPTQCKNDCTALTEGLTVDCATCIAQHIVWQNVTATCLGYFIPATTNAQCATLCTPMQPG